MTTPRDKLLDPILVAAANVAESLPPDLVAVLTTVDPGEIGEAFEGALLDAIQRRERQAA